MALTPDPWFGWADLGGVQAARAGDVITCTGPSCKWQIVVPNVPGGAVFELRFLGRAIGGTSYAWADWRAPNRLAGEVPVTDPWQHPYSLPFVTPSDVAKSTLYIGPGQYSTTVGAASFEAPQLLIDGVELFPTGFLPRADGGIVALVNATPVLRIGADGALALDALGGTRTPVVTTEGLPYPTIEGGRRLLTDGRDGWTETNGIGGAWRLPNGKLARLAPPPRPWHRSTRWRAARSP